MFASPHNLPINATPELNTTPLIDVMLVLLMMFMLTVPISTHVVHLDAAASHHARNGLADLRAPVHPLRLRETHR